QDLCRAEAADVSESERMARIGPRRPDGLAASIRRSPEGVELYGAGKPWPDCWQAQTIAPVRSRYTEVCHRGKRPHTVNNSNVAASVWRWAASPCRLGGCGRSAFASGR